MGIPTAGSNLLSLQPGAGHRAGVQAAGAVWPALCPRDRLPCGLCTKPHLPAPAWRWGAAPANWSAGHGQRRPAGAGGEGGGLCSHHRPSGWGAREEGWEGQDPPAALQGRQVVRSSALSVETPRKKCGYSSSCCQPRRRGPQGRGDVPPPPEGRPPPALTTPQGSSSLRLRPCTRRMALTGPLDYEGANPRLPLAGGRPGAQSSPGPGAPPAHQSIQDQPHVQPGILSRVRTAPSAQTEGAESKAHREAWSLHGPRGVVWKGPGHTAWLSPVRTPGLGRTEGSSETSRAVCGAHRSHAPARASEAGLHLWLHRAEGGGRVRGGAEPWAPAPCACPGREEVLGSPPLSLAPAGPAPHLLPELGSSPFCPSGVVRLRTGGSWACAIPTAPANPTFFLTEKERSKIGLKPKYFFS